MYLTKDFLDFIDLLNRNEVQYMLVGGYAVAVHGYVRYTGDMDVWVKSEEENIDKLMKTLKEFGGPVSEINRDVFFIEPTKDNPSPGISFGREPVKLEIITSIDGVNFDECFSNIIEKKIENTLIKFISYNDLKKNKLSTQRLKDKADIEELEKKRKKE
jgi:hypothetical protein